MARLIFTARPDALARIPLRPGDVCDHDTDHTDPLLHEAVTVASGAAKHAADRSVSGALTWRAYATRSRTRTTPQGVFAGVAPATFSGEPELRLGAGHRTLTNPEPRWLSLLARSIIDGAEGLSTVRLTTSNVAVARGGRWEIERPLDGTSARPVTISVRDTEVTAFVLHACRDGLPAAQAIAELAARWPRAAPESGPQLVRELIDGGFLLHDLLPHDPRCDPLGHLLDRLPPGSPHRHRLERLRDRLAEADQHRPGNPTRLDILADASAIAREILPTDRILRVDTAADATVILPARIARKAAEAADVLWRIGWGTDPLTAYHQRFRTRYGTSQAVPLPDVLDPVIGIGPPDDLTPVGTGAPDPRRERVLALLLSDALSHGATEIVLDEATVDRLTNRSQTPAPRNAEIYVRVLGLDAGTGTGTAPNAYRGFHLAVCGGSQDALSTTGRFAALLGRPPTIRDTADGALVAELVVRPRTDTVASVTVETGLAAHRIPVGVPPRYGDIDLTDLVVFSTGRHLIVWSRTHGRRVLPVLYSRIAPHLLPPVARFLAVAGHAGQRPWHCWSWRDLTAPFTPAVRYRGTWLTPARWILPPHLTRAAEKLDGWEAALISWRSATRPQPPDIVITDDVDRQLPLDLRRADDRELLRRYVRRGLSAVTGPHGDASTSPAVLPGPDGSHLLELVVCLDRAAPAPTRALAPPPVRRPGDGLYLPGGPWLSLAIQAPAACHEQILRSLTGHVEKLSGHWDRWFWLRYHDPRHGEHLRVRCHADPAVVTGTVLPALSAWASGLHRQRLISGFCVEPYDREIERYGGPDAVTAAERFFDADSRLALDVLSTTRDQDARLVITAVRAATIASRIGTGMVAGGRLDRPSHHRVNALRSQARTAASHQLSDAWESALDAYAAMLPPAKGADVAADLIHMLCNRLVPGSEDLVRALAADLIARNAHRTEGSR